MPVIGRAREAAPASKHAISRLDTFARWAIALVLGVGVASLMLAMAGILYAWLALGAGLGLTLLIRRLLPLVPSERVSMPASLALLTVVVAVFGLGVSSAHEHILATRDSGTYVATAGWLIENHSLRMDVSDPVFDGVPVAYESLGFPEGPEENILHPQFMHTFPSLLAISGSLGGFSWMYLVNPAIAGIGLLCLFALSRRLMSTWWAIVVVGLVAASMPFLYFSRAPFSEPLALVLTIAGLWIATESIQQRSLILAAGAGLLLGAVSLARIDGIVVLLGLIVFRTLCLLGEKDQGPEVSTVVLMDRMIAVAFLPFVLSLTDLFLFSRQYLVDHGALVAAVLAVSLLLFLTGRFADRVSDWFVQHRRGISKWSATAMATYLLYAWIVRPSVESPTRRDIYGLEGLQSAAGVAVEPLRSYAELSVHWLSWYLGIPLLALGLVGLVVFVMRLLSGQNETWGPFLCVAAVLTLLYVYRPSINPDQIWATRRFVPLVIPALVMLAAALTSEAVGRFARRPALTSVVIVAILAAPVLVTSARIGLVPEMDGAAYDLQSACRLLGDEAALLFIGETGRIQHDALGPPLRGACGVPVAAESSSVPLQSDQVEALSRQARNQGHVLWVVGETPEADHWVRLFDTSYRYMELTLFEAPDEWETLDVRIPATRLP